MLLMLLFGFFICFQWLFLESRHIVLEARNEAVTYIYIFYKW